MRRSPSRYSLLAAALVAAIASAGMLTGCDNAELGAAPAQTQAIAADADGEALLRGLLFGEGEAAKALPEVWDTPNAGQALASLTPEMRGQQDALMAALHEADPSFFNRFEREMTSGDLQRVGASLRSATEFLEASAPTAARQTAEVEQDVVFVYAMVCGYYWVCPPPVLGPVYFIAPASGGELFAKDGAPSLRREELVGRLAERLHRTR